MRVQQEVDGRAHHPGDWVEVEDVLGRQWLVSGMASAADLSSALPLPPGCGVLVRGEVDAAAHLRKAYRGLPITAGGGLALPYERTVIWDPTFKLRPELLYTGFSLLKRWPVAAPMVEGAPGPLPLYDIRLIFIRREESTEQLIEIVTGKLNEQEAFSAALRECGITALGLPDAWIGG